VRASAPIASKNQQAVAALIVLIVFAIAYAVLAAFGIAPVPNGVERLAAQRSIGRGPALVAGYYISQPFTSLGSGLPPYVLAADTAPGSPAIHVKPTLPDVRVGRVAAIVDTTTGDGSQWSPDLVHTLAGWNTFVAGLFAMAALALVVAWLVGGLLASALFASRRSRASARIPQKQT